MQNEETSLSVGMAWLLAILTVAAAGIVIVEFAIVDLPVYGSSYTRRMVNWPIIIWCAVGAIYALLYAQLFSNVSAVSAKSDRILRLLQESTQNVAVAQPDPIAELTEANTAQPSAETTVKQATVETKAPVISGRFVAVVFVLIVAVLISTTYLNK